MLGTFYAKEGQELIHGSRRFYPYRSGEFTYLQGGAGVVWHTPDLKAVCMFEPGADVAKHIKSGRCSCGINIAKGDSAHNASGPIYAEMIGWGAFMEGERGWHCEYGEIVAIRIDDPALYHLKPGIENAYPGVHVQCGQMDAEC